MSAQNKLDLISKLTNTVKTDIEKEKSDFYKAFGGWDEKQSAEELIDLIKESRTFNRTLKNFLSGIQILPIFPALDIYAEEKARLQKSGKIIDVFD